MTPRPLPPLYLITDRRLAADLPAAIARTLAALPAGAVMVQVREKDLGARALLALVRDILAVARPHGSPVLVNDRVDVALAAGADGVHLPAAGMTPLDVQGVAAAAGRSLVVGASCHGPEDVRAARDAGADFAVCGPVWATPSKAAYGAPLGLEVLAGAVRAGAPLPVYAIGGVDADRARLARAAGVAGIAAIRALLTAATDELRALHTACA